MGNQIQNSNIAQQFVLDTKHIDYVMFVRDIETFAWYKEDEGYFQVLDPEEMLNKVYLYALDRGKTNITTQITKDITNQIKWTIKRKVASTVSNYIAFKDKLLNLSTFQFEPFDFRKPAFSKIDVDSTLVGKQDPVVFRNFISTVLVKEDPETGAFITDDELVTVAQEMFGFYFINDLKAESVFFLVGDGANGKSRMTEVIENIVGSQFTSGMSIEDMTMDKFATSDLVGKKLNVCREEESKYVKSSLFKALITGDSISAVRKFGARFNFKPTAKHLFATNNLPTFEGVAHALTRRVKIIPFRRKFAPKEKDIYLKEKLEKELPGIVAWTIEGAKRLIANNYCFSESSQMEEKSLEFEENISSAIMFLRSQYVEDERGYVSNDDLFADYAAWCITHGRKSMNSTNFHRDIAGVLTLKSKMQHDPDRKKSIRGKMLRPRTYDS